MISSRDNRHVLYRAKFPPSMQVDLDLDVILLEFEMPLLASFQLTPHPRGISQHR
jgi:hypothetical protein